MQNYANYNNNSGGKSFFCTFARHFYCMDKPGNTIYSPSVIDFVTVAAEYCKYMEQCATSGRDEFVDVMRKLLPMLYLKAAMAERPVGAEGYVEHPVTEDDYNYVASSVASVMKDRDDYLDVFLDDFKYSDVPIRRQVSEDLADIYQALRDFVEVYRQGFDDAMEVALSEVLEQFDLGWGQRLLGALRTLHEVYCENQTD